MAINATVARQQEGGWLFSWSGGTAPYSIWLNGTLLTTTSSTSYEYVGGDYVDTPPPLEIISDGETAENQTHPPYALLQWRGIQSAAAYVVEKYNGSSWVEQAQIMEDDKGDYQWQSAALDDDTTHQYRVTAIGPTGQEGTPLTFSIDMVRNPAPPSVSLSISSSGDVVVSAA